MVNFFSPFFYLINSSITSVASEVTSSNDLVASILTNLVFFNLGILQEFYPYSVLSPQSILDA